MADFGSMHADISIDYRWKKDSSPIWKNLTYLEVSSFFSPLPRTKKKPEMLSD